jgi:hypothetical protein
MPVSIARGGLVTEKALISDSKRVRDLPTALPLFFLMFLAGLSPTLTYAGEQVLEQKCGNCHSMTSELDRTEFDELLGSYNWSNWSSVPLRVWISNHHKPRIPSINISQAEAEKINAYIADLSSLNRKDEGESAAAESFFADAQVSEEDSAEKLPHASPAPIGAEQGEENKQATVDFSECLNCQ